MNGQQVELDSFELGELLQQSGIIKIRVLPQQFLSNDNDECYVLLPHKHFSKAQELLKKGQDEEQ